MDSNYKKCNCGELRKENCNSLVNLNGWIHRRRDHGGVIFIDLRDREGITQLVFDPIIDKRSHEIADEFRSEWVIGVKGRVRLRGEGMTNSNIATGEIEVEVAEASVFSKANTPPFSICDQTTDTNEELRLKYRYLDIRRGFILKNLMVRHKVFLAIRNFFDSLGFTEVNTPILANSTPEGARDYLIPSRLYRGMFYALPQSPQIFKQILMVSGVEKYFQIATCFRDEDLRSNRQPEFTQLDVEMSFGNTDDLFAIIEKMVMKIFSEISAIELKTPFIRIPYKECMAKYGTDKPDMRFDMELVFLTDIVKKSSFKIFLEQINDGKIVKGFCIKEGKKVSRREIDEYIAFAQKMGASGLAWMRMSDGKLQSSIAKYFAEEILSEIATKIDANDGDLLFMVCEEESKVNQILDHLRRKVAKDLNLIDDDSFKFLWVTDFPLFSWDVNEKRLESEHHPFTAPHREDASLLDSQPENVRSSSYDLVVNGYELGSGSERIFDNDMQKKIFDKINLSDDEIQQRFGFFLQALQHGTPPHLGIALGLERLLMILLKTDNIRDVIAFPKTNSAMDLMVGSPSPVSEKQLKELKIIVES